MADLPELEAWAGPAWAELTPAQRESLAHASDRIRTDYPDDPALRDAALSATVQYMLGETDLDTAGDVLLRARQAEAEARAAARQVARLAYADGVSESEIAARLGVQRAKTVRTWLGKHPLC